MRAELLELASRLAARGEGFADGVVRSEMPSLRIVFDTMTFLLCKMP